MWPVVEERRDDTTGVVPHHPCIPEGDAATPAADHNALHPSPPHPRPFAVPPPQRQRRCVIKPGVAPFPALPRVWGGCSQQPQRGCAEGSNGWFDQHRPGRVGGHIPWRFPFCRIGTPSTNLPCVLLRHNPFRVVELSTIYPWLHLCGATMGFMAESRWDSRRDASPPRIPAPPSSANQRLGPPPGSLSLSAFDPGYRTAQPRANFFHPAGVVQTSQSFFIFSSVPSASAVGVYSCESTPL